MTNARWLIIAVLLALTVTETTLATAQVAVKAEDLTGTWEMVNIKDLKTGEIVGDASRAREWIQLTRSHWMVLSMLLGRSVVSPPDFAKLSPEEKVKTNYARVWNEKNEQIFGARGGTYSLDGDKLYKKATIALNPANIGAERVVKIVRLDKNTLITQMGVPFLNPTGTRELTFRRIE